MRKKKRIVRKLTGWGTRGRLFSEKEYNRSFIKSSLKMNYSSYLKEVSKTYSSRNKRLRRL